MSKPVSSEPTSSEPTSPQPRMIAIGATGTEVGKTWVSRGIARAWRRRGYEVRALKPLETGVEPTALDASALSRAAGHPPIHEGFYRVRPPVAPLAATRMGEDAPPSIPQLVGAVERAAGEHPRVLVEAAGGVLVPITAETFVVDLFAALGEAEGARLVLVTRDGLGVLSHTLAAVEACRARGVTPLAIAMTPANDDDPSMQTNRALLAELAGVDCFVVPRTHDDDDALADAIEASGLMARIEAE